VGPRDLLLGIGRALPGYEVHSSEWKLYIHDLTKNDIIKYVCGSLHEHSRYLLSLKNVKPERHNIKALVQIVVEKAQGVFLWVYLVTVSLQRGSHKRG
jgi:hypothetical protein